MNSIIKYYQDMQRSCLRRALRDIRDSAKTIDKEIVHDACNFFTRYDDYDQVLSKNFGRYGTQIINRKSDGDTDKYVGQEQYYAPNLIARPGEREKFESGLYETVVVGIAQTILNTNACLFTQPENRFQFLSGEKTSDEAEELITMHRDFGGMIDRLIQVDYMSGGVVSCLLHIYPKGEWLAYDIVWPSQVKIKFGDTVVDITKMRPKGIERGVDFNDLEDASAVIVCLGQAQTQDYYSSPDENVYQAYVGQCGDYPYGRMVRYRASEYWPIPDPGDAHILYEYERPDIGRCNPMTHVAKVGKKGVGAGFEYPFIILRGDDRYGATECLPTSTTFYKNCLELETDWSHVLGCAMRAARGKDVVSLGNIGDRLPESLDVVVLQAGCQYQYITGNQGGVQAGMDTIAAATRGVASAKGVPPYVIIGPVPAQPESGIALAIRTAPLIDSRSRRIRINTREVDKIYKIETALLMEINPATESIFAGVEQTWTPGEYRVPTDQATLLDNLEKARRLEVTNQVDTVRIYHGLKTDEDAMDLIADKAEKDPDYRGLDEKTTEEPDESGRVQNDDEQQDIQPDEETPSVQGRGNKL